MVKTVCAQDKCTGCMACVDSCARNAIQIVDSLSCYNAVIDEANCVDCNRCQNVCQVNHPVSLQKPIYWCEGWANSQEIREASSSGGYALAIEKAFLKNGGWVCSCTFADGRFTFSLVNKEEDAIQFAGSKYVKSDPRGIYSAIQKKLRDGEKVLFVGLPCQSAALKNYVRHNQECLYTIDLICHGTPSPQILELFLKDHGLSLKTIDKLSFRENTNFKLDIVGKSLTVPAVRDYYTMTFLRSTTYTENCYSCRYATLNRVSDISLGDSWGSEQPKSEIEKGVSFALVQSEKGKELLDMADLKTLDTDLDRAVAYNHQLHHPSIKPQERVPFFAMLNKGKSFTYAVKKSYPSRYYKNCLKTILYHARVVK